MPPRRRSLALLLVLGCALAGAALTLLTGPHTPRLGPAETGDRQLASDVRACLRTERGYQSLSAARLRDGQVAYAGLGDAGHGTPPTSQTPFELGSITKTFTGLLLADGVDRGELRLEAPLSTYLRELTDTPVGSSTLRQLATHTAGLPSFPSSTTPLVVWRLAGNENPYPGSTDDVIAQAATTKIKNQDHYAYSNLGMTLLGYAEARAAGAPDWPAFATQRLLRPLGMAHTTFARSGTDVPVGAAPPTHENGWPASPWVGPAFAPAGSSTWTTAEDLMRFARAVLDGTAPGTRALDPIMPIPGGQIGLAWHLVDRDGQMITWHNGGTGGSRSILALDRDRRQAVVILGNSARDTDTTGRALAAAAPGLPVSAVERTMISWPAVLASACVGLVLVLGLLPATRRPHPMIMVVGSATAALAGLLILLARGPWMIIPTWVWGAVVGSAVAFLTLSVRRSRALAAGAPRRRWRTRLSWLSSLVVLALAIWML